MNNMIGTTKTRNWHVIIIIFSITLNIALSIIIIVSFYDRDILLQWHNDPNNRYKIIEKLERSIKIWNLSKDEIINTLGKPDYYNEDYVGDYINDGEHVGYRFYIRYRIAEKQYLAKNNDVFYIIVFTENDLVKRTFTVPSESAYVNYYYHFQSDYDIEGDFR